MTSVLALATLGGLASFASTAVGALISFGTWKARRFGKIKFSIDFALGLMISAVAFSLVGPAAKQTAGHPGLLSASLIGFAIGGIVIYGIKYLIERKSVEVNHLIGLESVRHSELLLALALMIHNFPEGLASGAALAGLDLTAAVPILSSIAIQNIPEGLLMVVCLRAMGWSQKNSFLGGLASGLVELVGGIAAGFALSWVSHALPVILMLAGGAMFTSVVIELLEKGKIIDSLKRPEFALGLASIPILNYLIS